MNARNKVTLAVVVIFLMVFSVLAVVMFYQAKTDLEKEGRAAIEMAQTLVQTDISAPQLRRILESNRDLSVLSPTQKTASEPLILVVWESLFANPHPVYTLTTKSGETIDITASSVAELEEITATMVNVFFIFVFALLVTLFTLRFAVNTRLKPLAELRAGLDSLKDGQFELSRASTDIAEIQTLIDHYNNLIATLETKDSQVTVLRQRLSALQEDERRRLARELHDNLGQLITGITVQAYMLDKQKGNPAFVAQASANIQQQCHAVHQGVRDLTNQLYPVFLSKLGLTTSIEQLVQNWQHTHQIQVQWLQTPQYVEPDLTRDTHIYRIVQEIMTNIAKHAKATRVTVGYRVSQGQLRLAISDDGAGFNPSAQGDIGLGLSSIRERAEILDAELTIDSNANGTRVELMVNLGE